MKAETMRERPVFELMKQNDVISFFHLQYPRWLIDDPRYSRMSLQASHVYMLLFNRFLLSKSKGWANSDNEVFIIYTRKELAEKLGVSEKRVSAAMSELKRMSLIWERRCGRGFANQIYLSKVEVSEADAAKAKGGPLDPQPPDEDKGPQGGADEDTDPERRAESRPDKTTGLDFCPGKEDDAQNAAKPTVPPTPATQDPPEQPFKTRQNVGSRTAETAVQDPPFCPPSYINKREKDKKSYEQSQSKSRSRPPNPPAPKSADADGLTGLIEERMLNMIIKNSEADCLEAEEASVIKDAIERLFYSESRKVGGAVYPNSRIRLHLMRLNIFIVQSALGRYYKNQDNVTDSSAYVTTVLFNTIMESKSDLVVDPYLNRFRLEERDKLIAEARAEREAARGGTREGRVT